MSEPLHEGKAPLSAFPTWVKLCLKIFALLNSSGRWLSPAVLHIPRMPPSASWGWEAAYSPPSSGSRDLGRAPPRRTTSGPLASSLRRLLPSPISTRQGEHHRCKMWLHVCSLLSLPRLSCCWALFPAPAFPAPSSTKLLGLHHLCWLLHCPGCLCDPELLQTRHETVTNSQGLSEELYLTSAFQNQC